jgi:hypothetical protein
VFPWPFLPWMRFCSSPWENHPVFKCSLNYHFLGEVSWDPHPPAAEWAVLSSKTLYDPER